MTSSPPPPEVSPSEGPGRLPRVFGRYVLFDQIGRGGMANIYLARADTALGGSRLCVVKQILPELGNDPQFERLLIEEAKLAARLTHANIVQVFDLGRESDRLFIGMEYVEGFDLNQLLHALSKAKVSLPGDFVVFIMREVLRGLDYAHRIKGADGRTLGLVHRDVSPSNVLVSFEGEVKLCDFGIARALTASHDDGSARASLPTKVIGKSAYMAPEHARGEPIDARADVFAAGILLWELCAGRRLYRGSEEEMLAQARQAKVPPLPERGLPDQPKLQAVLDKALARFRDERFQSAQEYLRALEDYALGTKLMASQLRFGTFLTQHFASQIVELRRERERAARSFNSEVPPALAPSRPAQRPEPSSPEVPSMVPYEDEDSEEDAPTTVSESPLFLSEETDEPLGLEEPQRAWSEPGAIPEPMRPLDSARITLREPGIEDLAPAQRSASLNVDDLDLERSLGGLQVLADQTKAEHRALTSSAPAPGGYDREWLWYAVALAILALGVVGYLWP